MTTTKIPPPRKLTESEDIDSFDDWWFQAVCYYGRDENFKDIFNSPNFTWQSKSVANRGLTTELQAANLTCLLRALATHAVGPYIKTNITDKAKSLDDVKNEFMKYLEIEVNDFTALHWFTIKRKQTERPLVFFYRLRYHMTKHLVKRHAIIEGVALLEDETLSPSLERLIVMEWLHRMDPRLIKFVQEKFSTELSTGSTVLATMVETLAKHIDSYISTINALEAIGAVSPSNPSITDSPDQEDANVDDRGAYRFDPRGGFHGRAGFENQPRQKGSIRENQSSNSSCEYCYIQSKTRNIDFNHPISRCPEMAAMHGSADMVDDDTNIFEEEHEFETFAQEFIDQDDWHEVATDTNYTEKIVTFSDQQEPPHIMNITGIGTNDESIGTIPRTPVQKLPAKPIQPPSRPTPCDKSQLSLSQEFVKRSQQTSPGNFIHSSMQTFAIQSADLFVQTESNNEESVTDPDNTEVGGVVALQAQVEQLKKEVAKLVFENNRYHFAISNCTFCASDDVTSDASISLDASIRASTPVSSALPSSGLDPALFPRTIPALMSLSVQDMRQVKVDNVDKSKDKTFISRMVRTLAKLERTYLTTRHKKKRLFFTRNQKTGPIILKERASICNVLTAPEPEESTVLESFPQLQSLSEDLANFAKVPNPKVSSGDASTQTNDDQSNPEVKKSVNISEESETSTSTSLPLGQDSLIYQNLDSSPSPPTARSTSTTDLLLDMFYEFAPLIPAAPLMPTLSPRPLVISRPAGTCDEQSITINLLPVDDVSREPNDDVIDQVPIGNNFLAVTYENYPIFLKFLAVSSPGDGPVVQQDEEAVPVPPPPDIDGQDRPQRHLRQVDHRSLHEYFKEGEGAWLYGRESKVAWLPMPQLQTRQEGDREDPREEMEDGESRGAPERLFSLFQIV